MDHVLIDGRRCRVLATLELAQVVVTVWVVGARGVEEHAGVNVQAVVDDRSWCALL